MPAPTIAPVPAACGVPSHDHGTSPFAAEECVALQAEGVDPNDICRWCGTAIGWGHEEDCPALRWGKNL